MKKFKVVIVLLIKQVIAVVPVTDIAQQAIDASTMAQYEAQVSMAISKMGTLTTAYDQVQNLQGLQKLQAGTTLCKLCDLSTSSSLKSYQQSINDDLCSQISLSYTNITGIKTAINTIDQIMTLFATNPMAAANALRQASTAIQTVTGNTLAQMQMMQAQAVQKTLAEEKISQQTHDADMQGMTNVSY